MKALLLALTLTSSLSALAKDCSDLTSTHDIRLCESERLEVQDNRLNKLYGVAMKKLDSIGKQKLRKAQQAWIVFRDAECDSRADEMRGGTMETVITASCLASMTQDRADDLQAIVDR